MGRVGALLLTILCLGLAVSFTPGVQKLIAKRVFQNQFEADSVEFFMDHFHFDQFGQLNIEGLLLSDKHEDTLFYIGSLSAQLGGLNMNQSRLSVNQVYLNDTKFHIKHYQGDQYANIRFFLDKFASENKDSSASNFEFTTDEIHIRNLDFKYEHYEAETTPGVMNFEDIHVWNFDADVHDLNILGSTVTAEVDQISLNEKSGFVIDSLKTACLISSDSMVFNGIELLTPNSQLDADYSMEHGHYEYFGDYLEKVVMHGNLRKSSLEIRDVAYFTSNLKAFDEHVAGSAKFDGTVSDFLAHELNLQVGTNSLIRGAVAMKGLPEIDSTFMDINLVNSRIHPKDLGEIKLEAFSDNLDFEIPVFVQKYGVGEVSGSMQGYYYNFSSEAEVHGENGDILGDFILVQGDDSLLHYQGEVQTNDLQVGYLLENEELGSISALLKVNGKGTSKETLDATVEGNIDEVIFQEYPYQNIFVDGLFKNELFDGKVAVDDPNLELNFQGRIDFRHREPRFQFRARIDTLYPVALNLLDRDSSAFISTDLEFDTKGLDLSTFAGRAEISNFLYQEKGKRIVEPEFKIRSYDVNEKRHIEFRSDLAEGMAQGTYHMPELEKAFRYMIHQSLPKLVEEELETEIPHDFEFEVNLKKVNPVLDIFYPELQLDSGLAIDGLFSGPENRIELNLKSDWITYGQLEVDTIELNLLHEDSSFHATIDMTSLILDEEISYREINSELYGANDSLHYVLSNDNRSRPNFKSDITVHGKVTGQRSFEFSFDSSYVVLADSLWSLTEANRISFDTNRIAIQDFRVTSSLKKISVNGAISKDSSDALEIGLEDLNLGNFARIVGIKEAQLSGIADGNVIISNVYTQPELTSTLYINDLGANGEYIGSGPLSSSWNPSLNRFDIDFDLYRPADSLFNDTLRSLRFYGYYYPQEEDTALHLKLLTDGFKIGSIEPLVSEYIDQLEGEIVGEVDLTGNFKEPVLTGNMKLMNSGFRIPYLNTKYFAHDQTLILEPDWFGFNSMTLTDENGRKANAMAGTVFHENWKDFNFDVLIDVDTFLSLNTTKKDNDLFYGKAFLTGWINVSTGYQDKIKMELDAEANNNSELYIPLYSANEVYENDFIRFVNHNQPVVMEDVESSVSGIDMDFKFNIDPSTEIQLIFDPNTGEVLRAQGGGDINMLVTPEGDFEMYGIYEVRNGDYLFNFENLLTKRFILSQGGTISFNGDPFNARLDVTAKYKVKAGLDKILGDTNYSQKVDNICLMHLTDQLEEPNITFDIEVLNVDDDIESRVMSQMPTPEDVNKQVFSLMLFNDYSPPNNSFSGSGFAGATTSELLANQINSWLSRMDNQVINVGVSELKSDNVEVELSKQMFDNRLIFESNVGVDNSNTSNTNGNQNQFVGDFKLEYMVRKDGKVRAKVFNRSETYRIEDQGNSATQTQGVGIFYQENFDSFGQLFRKMFTRKNKEEKKEEKRKKKEAKSANGQTAITEED